MGEIPMGVTVGLLVMTVTVTHIYNIYLCLKSCSWCCVDCLSVAEISCNFTGPSPAMLAAVGERGYRVAELCPVGSGR
jgi:hypothetical protein